MSGQREIVEATRLLEEVETHTAPIKKDLKELTEIELLVKNKSVAGFIKGLSHSSVKELKGLIALLDKDDVSVVDYITAVSKLNASIKLITEFKEVTKQKEELEVTLEEIMSEITL